MIDINELRRLAKAATPPRTWYVQVGDYIYGSVTDEEEEWQPDTEDGGSVNFEDSVAAFIAAASPTAIIELLDRLEAAENDALEQARLNGIGAERELALMAKLEAAEKERDTLQAKIAEMEKQEPVAFGLYSGWALKATYLKDHEACEQRDRRQLTADLSGSLEAYRVVPLYTLPGAQPAPSIPDDVMRDAKRYRFLRAANSIPISSKAARDPVVYDEAMDAAMLAAAPEAKP